MTASTFCMTINGKNIYCIKKAKEKRSEYAYKLSNCSTELLTEYRQQYKDIQYNCKFIGLHRLTR